MGISQSKFGLSVAKPKVRKKLPLSTVSGPQTDLLCKGGNRQSSITVHRRRMLRAEVAIMQIALDEGRISLERIAVAAAAR